MRIKIAIAATVIGSLCTMGTLSESQAAAPNSTSTKQKSYIDGMKAGLNECKTSYSIFAMEMDITRQLVFQKQRQAKAQARLLEMGIASEPILPTPDPEPKYLACIANQKKLLLPKAKPFITSFKSTDAKQQAKTMVAQWMTTMDSIGKPVREAEEAKFETLANGLLIDMQ